MEIEVSKCSSKNGANKLAQHRVATNIQFVKKCNLSAMCKKAKCNKLRYACM